MITKVWGLLLAFVLISICIFSINPATAKAVTSADWNPGRIIDDYVFQNKNTMTVAQIQQFLESKVPVCDTWGVQPMWSGGPTRAQWSATNGKDLAPYTCLKNYVENPITKENNAADPRIVVAGGLSAAQLIYNAAQAQNINPQVYLTLMQKEQSLVTDDWPYTKQFERATGNNCPDTAPCNPAFAWLWTQVSNSGAQFNYYVNHFDQYNYAPGWNNILYNPNTSCGTQRVYIENRYTAALYIYTPYVPNQTALNNMYGTGDPCSSYGNRNFWRLFNDWFGSSLWRYTYAQGDGGSGTQYLIFDGMKIPLTYDALFAWGIVDKLVLTTLPQAKIDATQNYQGVLTNWVQGSNGVFYMIDGGKHYTTDAAGMALWGASATAPLPTDFITNFTTTAGQLGYGVASESSPHIFLMDGGVLRQFGGPALLHAYLGVSPNIISVSSRYFSTMVQDGLLDSPKVTVGLTNYIVAGSRSYSLDAYSNQLTQFWSTNTISSMTLARYANGGPLHYLVRSDASPAIYLLNTDGKHIINAFDVFDDLRKDDGYYETVLPQSVVDLMPESNNIPNTFFRGTSEAFLIKRGKIQLSDDILTAYAPNTYAVSVSDALLSMMNVSTERPSQYAQVKGTAGIYLISGGKRHGITTYNTYLAFGSPVPMQISQQVLNAIPGGEVASPYVVVSGNGYLLDANTAYSTLPDTVQEWRLGSPMDASQELLSGRIIKPLSNTIQRQNGEFCLVDSGAFRCAEQFSMIFVWRLTDGVIHPTENVLRALSLIRRGRLTQYITAPQDSQYAGSVFLVDGPLLHGFATPTALNNYGFLDPALLLTVSQSTILNRFTMGTSIHPYLARSMQSGATYFVEVGKKRLVDSSVAQSWFTPETPVSILNEGVLSLMQTGDIVTSRSVTTPSNPAIFGLTPNGRVGITSYQKYLSGGFAPHMYTNELTLSVIPQIGIY